MNVEWIPGIASVSGTLYKGKNGLRIVATTRKAQTTNKQKTRLYLRTAESYQRKTPYSEAELKRQDLFAQRQSYVKQLMAADPGLSKKEAWSKAKQDIK